MPSLELATIVDLTALGLAAILALQLLSHSRSTAGSTRSTSASDKRLKLVEKLRGKAKRTGPDGKPLILRDHEIEVAADVVSASEINVTFSDIGGHEAIGRQLQQAILLPFTRPELFKQSKLLKPPKGILLHGPPGTGKTLLARAIAREAAFTFIALNPARLLSKWYGESNKFAEAYFTLANKLAPSIIFIDEIDCLFRSRGHEHEATSMLKAQFLSLWDGLLTASEQRVIVIAATNRPADVDPAVLRRLPLSFEVDLPAAAGREDVLRLLLRDEPLAREIDLRALAAATDGYSGSDLDQLCKSAAMRALEDALAAEVAAEQASPSADAAAAALASPPVAAGVVEGFSGSAEGLPSALSPASPTTTTQPSCTAASCAEAGGTDVLLARSDCSGGGSTTTMSAGTAACAGSRGTSSDVTAANPPLQLRQLTLDDFLHARAIVRPTRGRFAGVHHEVHHVAPPPPSSFDPELYD